MPTFDAWDVVKVPFPYTDRPVREHRPALVVAAKGLEDRHGLLWVLMITSLGNQGWQEDVVVSDLMAAGLPVESVIRAAKIATIESKEAERLGRLADIDREKVRLQLDGIMAATKDSRC